MLSSFLGNADAPEASVRAFRWKLPYYLLLVFMVSLRVGHGWLQMRNFLGELLWHDISTQKSVNIENRIHCILYNAFYFRCSHITELTWWARPPISDFDDGNCSFKCLKLLTHTVLPYVINIWGLIEKNSLTVCKVSNELLSAFFDFRFFRRRHFGMQELGWN